MSECKHEECRYDRMEQVILWIMCLASIFSLICAWQVINADSKRLHALERRAEGK